MTITKEYRITLPMTVQEYQIGQLYSVAEASLGETGGGDGVEILINEPFENEKFGKGQYTKKRYHLQNKVPGFVRIMAPKGSLVLEEEAWNAFPYCKTILTNPGYMKKDFKIEVSSWHYDDDGAQENVHKLTKDELKKRSVVQIDIANDSVDKADYKSEYDPSKFKSVVTERGPLNKTWKSTTKPLMTCYKLVTGEFKFFGLQSKMENLIQETNEKLFRNFHRQAFCTIDKWHHMSIQDIRNFEESTRLELDKQRKEAGLRGTIDEDPSK